MFFYAICSYSHFLRHLPVAQAVIVTLLKHMPALWRKRFYHILNLGHTLLAELPVALPLIGYTPNMHILYLRCRTGITQAGKAFIAHAYTQIAVDFRQIDSITSVPRRHKCLTYNILRLLAIMQIVQSLMVQLCVALPKDCLKLAFGNIFQDDKLMINYASANLIVFFQFQNFFFTFFFH